MRFRSSTRDAKTVERYAAFIAVYVQKAITAASATDRKTRSSRVLTSPRTGASAASPRTNGMTPSPTQSAPEAQSPYTKIRCFQYVVTEYHWLEWWLMKPLM